ncbi:MAG: aspartate aminotransferase family protein [Myxococcales bacterium]|nr:aspartate aminotransferase family protein [Myxococcales bacterium]
MSADTLFEMVAGHARDYAESLKTRAVSPTATAEQLRASLHRALPQSPLAPEKVIKALVSECEPGLLHTAGPHFFGWVIGGALPAAQAADWLASVWDQNAGGFACSPAMGVLDEVCGAWLKELLDLPASASFALVTGCQMAHVTGLAAARYRLLERAGWDVGTEGLLGAPRLRVLSGEHHHETFARALRLLGLGTGIIERLALDPERKLDPRALEAALASEPEMGARTIVCLQAGDLNTGTCDDFEVLCEIAHRYGAWVHVDGAFGLWGRVSPKYAHLLAGVEKADSWATDGHKWLNVPYDCGYAFVADAEAHHASMAMDASYLIDAGGREPNEWNPEWSRRARGLPTYAVIRSLGREGIAQIVERCSVLAARLTAEIAALPGADLLHAPTLNQGLVRFLAADGRHDERTDAVSAALRADGRAWFGNTTWRGMRVMRISVCGWQTQQAHVDQAVLAVAEVLETLTSE